MGWHFFLQGLFLTQGWKLGLLRCRFFTSESTEKPCAGCAKSLQLCRTLCSPMDSQLPGLSVHGILQARLPKWVVISFSGYLPDPGIKPVSPALAGGFWVVSLPLSQKAYIYIYIIFLCPERELLIGSQDYRGLANPESTV